MSPKRETRPRRTLLWAELAAFFLANVSAYFNLAARLKLLPLEPSLRDRGFAYTLLSTAVLLVLLWLKAGRNPAKSIVRRALFLFIGIFILGLVGFWGSGFGWRRISLEWAALLANHGEPAFFGLAHAGFAGIIALVYFLTRLGRSGERSS